MRRGLQLLFVALTALVACGGGPMWVRTAPQYRPQVRLIPVRPGALYARWWQHIERCTGQRSRISTVRWLTPADPAISFPTFAGDAYGATYPQERVVIIAQPWLLDSGLVMHEIGHLWASPFYHDPRFYQRGPCARLVVCWGNCLSDTLPPPGLPPFSQPPWHANR